MTHRPRSFKGSQVFSSLLLALALLLAALPALAESGMIAYPGKDDPKPALGTDDLLEIHLINVQAADAILLRMGEHTMLIDSGRYRTYERITDYLKTLGIDELEYAFLTHPHDDHIGGFTKILNTVPVGTFLRAPLYDDFKSDLVTKLNKLLATKNIPAQTVDNGTVMSFGGATLTFMQWQKPNAAQNNRSMILKVEYGDRAILLCADIENQAQVALAEEYGNELRADIIKLPHHGLAPYMPELHEAVQASLATISNVKSDKIYDVLRSCEKRGVRWELTTKGTMICATDGTAWQVWRAKQ